MYYVIGLGNPGAGYHGTPHNIGRCLLEMLREKQSIDFSEFSYDKTIQSMISVGTIENHPVTLMVPETFMNKSGLSLKHIDASDYENIIVVYDDIDLPFGTVRLSRDRGNGGHNGIKSIEECLKTRTFIRFRVGVCPTDWLGRPRKPKGPDAIGRYLVRHNLSSGIQKQYPQLVERIESLLHSIVTDGYQKTISRQLAN